MDRALLADFLRARRESLQPEDVGLPRGSRRRAGGLRREEVMARIVERLSETPAMVFSRFGETLLQTRGAVALFGDYTPFGGSSRHLVDRWLTDPAARERYLVEVGVGRHAHLRRYWHAELGVLELCRQLLLD